jgi:hypothetical protein
MVGTTAAEPLLAASLLSGTVGEGGLALVDYVVLPAEGDGVGVSASSVSWINSLQLAMTTVRVFGGSWSAFTASAVRPSRTRA